MSILKPLYGTPTSITITTTSVASDTNLLAGRQSTQIDNTADLGDDSIFGGTIVTTGTPTAGTVIEVWIYGSWDGGTTRTSGMGATDAAFTLPTSGAKALLALAQVINQTDTTARTYTFGPVSVAVAFGGTMPDHWGVFEVQNTGTTLGASTLKYTPVQYQTL